MVLMLGRNIRRLMITVIVFALAGSALMVSSIHVFLRSTWIVIGRVVDELGNPIEGAEIRAFLGIGADSWVTTDATGDFRVRVAISGWRSTKGGSPGIKVTKRGYRDNVSYYPEWLWGKQFTQVTVKLQRSYPEILENGDICRMEQ